jgi:hypothetical protein
MPLESSSSKCSTGRRALPRRGRCHASNRAGYGAPASPSAPRVVGRSLTTSVPSGLRARCAARSAPSRSARSWATSNIVTMSTEWSADIASRAGSSNDTFWAPEAAGFAPPARAPPPRCRSRARCCWGTPLVSVAAARRDRAVRVEQGRRVSRVVFRSPTPVAPARSTSSSHSPCRSAPQHRPAARNPRGSGSGVTRNVLERPAGQVDRHSATVAELHPLGVQG